MSSILQLIRSPINLGSVFAFGLKLSVAVLAPPNEYSRQVVNRAFLMGISAMPLSTGRPDGSGGDGRQASHWKDDSISGQYLGTMDPTIGAVSITTLLMRCRSSRCAGYQAKGRK
jgi:hypothetical protein